MLGFFFFLKVFFSFLGICLKSGRHIRLARTPGPVCGCVCVLRVVAVRGLCEWCRGGLGGKDFGDSSTHHYSRRSRAISSRRVTTSALGGGEEGMRRSWGRDNKPEACFFVYFSRLSILLLFFKYRTRHLSNVAGTDVHFYNICPCGAAFYCIPTSMSLCFILFKCLFLCCESFAMVRACPLSSASLLVGHFRWFVLHLLFSSFSPSLLFVQVSPIYFGTSLR